jgi:hypothetical protein
VASLEDVSGRHVSEKAVRDRVEAASARADTSKLETHNAVAAGMAIQTAELKALIESAKLYNADHADAAYKESNDVNQKLKKLHEVHAAQGQVLERLLVLITRDDPAVVAAVLPKKDT